MAICQASFNTHGWGEFKMPTAAYFTATFTTRPTISCGTSIEGDALVETRFPRVTSGVHRWIRDISGFYTGAWVFFVVDTASPYLTVNEMRTVEVDAPVEVDWSEDGLPTPVIEDPGYDLIHDLTFMGIAIKALPSYLLDS